MSLLFTVFVVLVVGAIAVVAAGHGESMAEEDVDRGGSGLPEDESVTAAALREVRFSTTLRGYRASEVDALVERLARQLDEARERPTDVARAPYEAPPEA